MSSEKGYNDRSLIIVGLIFIILGIVFGVSAAHYLEKIGIPESEIHSFSIASSYLFYNGLGFLALAGIYSKFDFEIKNHYRLILFGVIFFAGSIFLLTIPPAFGVNIRQYVWPLTPLGGILMVSGWLTLLIKYLRTYK